MIFLSPVDSMSGLVDTVLNIAVPVTIFSTVESRFQEYSNSNRYYKCDEFIWSNYMALQYIQQTVDLSSTESEEGEDIAERKLKSKYSAASGKMAYLTYIKFTKS